MTRISEKKPLKTVFLLLVLMALVLSISGCVSGYRPTFLPAATATATPYAQPTTMHVEGTPVPTIATAPTAIVTPTQMPVPTPTSMPVPTPTSFPSNIPVTGGNLEVHFLDVGQGDSILVKYGNKCMLIDGGPIDAGPRVSGYLRSHGVSSIDVLVSTHPHADHIGGLLSVLNDFPVGVVYDSGQLQATQTYEQYLTLIDQKDIPYKVPVRGDTIDLGPGVTVQVFSPPSGGVSGDDLNENSIVLKITHGSVGYLMASDAGSAAESSMLSSGMDLNSDILKVGHHGSKYSSGSAFLAAVSPAVSVIEVGSNPYGHPAPETLAKLEAAGSKVYRTDRNGNVVITSNGATYSIDVQTGTASQALATTAPTVQATPKPTIQPTPKPPTPQPTQQIVQTPPAAPASAVYVGSAKSDKYHYPDCRWAKEIHSGNLVTFSSKADAQAKGYTPCKTCNP